MDSYEEEIGRRSGGPFTNRAERRLIRTSAEHWRDGRRYREEQGRRFKTYAGWIAVGAPAIIAAWKLVEGFLGKGTP